jgi:hypothetical protein
VGGATPQKRTFVLRKRQQKEETMIISTAKRAAMIPEAIQRRVPGAGAGWFGGGAAARAHAMGRTAPVTRADSDDDNTRREDGGEDGGKKKDVKSDDSDDKNDDKKPDRDDDRDDDSDDKEKAERGLTPQDPDPIPDSAQPFGEEDDSGGGD